MTPYADIALAQHCPDNKVHGAHMGPIWGRQDPGGPHVGPMNLAIWGLGAWRHQAIIWSYDVIENSIQIPRGQRFKP